MDTTATMVTMVTIAVGVICPCNIIKQIPFMKMKKKVFTSRHSYRYHIEFQQSQ